MKDTAKSFGYRVCDILASVTAFNRQTLLDDLRLLGENAFLEKYGDKENLPHERPPVDWPKP